MELDERMELVNFEMEMNSKMVFGERMLNDIKFNRNLLLLIISLS